MALRDLTEFLDDGALEYPAPSSWFSQPDQHPDVSHGDGRVYAKLYRVSSPSAKIGLWLTALADVGVKASAGADLAAEDVARLKLDDDGEKTLYQRVLGATYDEMLTDGIKWTVLQRIGQDAYLCFAMSNDVANAALVGQGEQAARANRATRRAAKKTAGSRSRRASTAGTGSAKGQASPTSGSSTSPSGPEEAATAV